MLSSPTLITHHELFLDRAWIFSIYEHIRIRGPIIRVISRGLLTGGGCSVGMEGRVGVGGGDVEGLEMSVCGVDWNKWRLYVCEIQYIRMI